MRLGVVADIHGNAVALDAVIDEGERAGVDEWWALGDLVLFGPRPVEVLERLRRLPGIAYVRGNTDRYVVTAAQPHPHATAAAAAGDAGLVERYAVVAAALGWTNGALAQAGLIGAVEDLPDEQRLDLPDGTRLLGIHASPGHDDGPGITNDIGDGELAGLLEGCDADVVIGGHTHDPTDRTVGGVRALNGGSVGMPRRSLGAGWLLVDADESGTRFEHRVTPFDVEAVVADLKARRHPSTAFVASVLRREHAFAH